MDPYWKSTDGKHTIWCADCMDVLPTLGKVDACVTDPPYSSRTHSGHDAGVSEVRRDGSNRRSIGYSPWTQLEVDDFVPAMCNVCSGWVVVMTDHVLAMKIQAVMERCGRYAFAPLPWYVPGSRVRLAGDGPSSWTAWIVVCRTAAQHRWGTLPGGYMQRGEQHHMGGKPVELMVALVDDYSRSGDTVLDPFCGSGTTGVACVKTGRRFLGIEREPKYCDIAVKRMEKALEERAASFDFMREPEPVQATLWE